MPIHYNSNQSYAFEIYFIFKTNINLICDIMNHWIDVHKCSSIIILVWISSYYPGLFVTTLTQHYNSKTSSMTFEPQHNHTSIWNMDDWWSIHTWSVAELWQVQETHQVDVWLDTTLHHLRLPAIHTGWGPSLEGLTGWPISILWLGAECDVHAEQRHHALDFNFGAEMIFDLAILDFHNW